MYVGRLKMSGVASVASDCADMDLVVRHSIDSKGCVFRSQNGV